MIINSRIPRVIEQPTPQQVLESALIRYFGKSIEQLRTEVRALEEQDLCESVCYENWE